MLLIANANLELVLEPLTSYQDNHIPITNTEISQIPPDNYILCMHSETLSAERISSSSLLLPAPSLWPFLICSYSIRYFTPTISVVRTHFRALKFPVPVP